MSVCEQPFPLVSRTMLSPPFSRRNQVWSHMRVTPRHDRVIVQPLEAGEQTVGSIIFPDRAKEKPQRGKVLSVGLGKVREDGSRHQPEVNDGDTILFGTYSGQAIAVDGED